MTLNFTCGKPLLAFFSIVALHIAHEKRVLCLDRAVPNSFSFILLHVNIALKPAGGQNRSASFCQCNLAKPKAETTALHSACRYPGWGAQQSSYTLRVSQAYVEQAHTGMSSGGRYSKSHHLHRLKHSKDHTNPVCCFITQL